MARVEQVAPTGASVEDTIVTPIEAGDGGVEPAAVRAPSAHRPGSWTQLAVSGSNPFTRANDVAFPSGSWTRGISHGEMIRAGYDQTLTILACRLQYLYQGMSPNASGDYNTLPWRLGLLTRTNSTC